MRNDLARQMCKSHRAIQYLKFARFGRFFFYGISFPDHALHSSFIQGMSTFSSSLTYLVKQSGKHVAHVFPSLDTAIYISYFYLLCDVSLLPSLSSKKECLKTSSIPLSIRYARKFMSAPVTVLDIPFSCLYWKEYPRLVSIGKRIASRNHVGRIKTW